MVDSLTNSAPLRIAQIATGVLVLAVVACHSLRVEPTRPTPARPFGTHAPRAEPEPTIRVRLEAMRGVTFVRVSAPGGLDVTIDGQSAANLGGTDELEIACGADGFQIAGTPAPISAGATGAVLELRPRDSRASGQLISESGSPIAWTGRLRLVRQAHGRSSDAIQLVPLETYVAAALFSEMPASFAPEALKAQAVAIRTYAAYQMATSGQTREFDVVDSVADLRYPGSVAIDARARQYASATRGQVLTTRHQGIAHLFRTYFHSTCGGATSSAQHVFGRFPEASALGGAAVNRCQKSSVYRWGYSMRWDEAREALRGAGVEAPRSIAAVEIIGADVAGRAKSWKFVGTDGTTATIDANRARLALGPGKRQVASTNCAITVEGEGARIRFSGRGWGHGVGMCQYGADGLGTDGLGFAAIVRAFYPGSTLTRLYR